MAIIDDSDSIRVALSELVRSEPDMVIVAEANSAETGIQRIRESQPDVVLLDYRLQDGNSRNLIEKVHAELPQISIVLYTMFAKELPRELFLDAGAREVLSKDADPGDLIDCIRGMVPQLAQFPSGKPAMIPHGKPKSLFYPVGCVPGNSRGIPVSQKTLSELDLGEATAEENCGEQVYSMQSVLILNGSIFRKVKAYNPDDSSGERTIWVRVS